MLEQEASACLKPQRELARGGKFGAVAKAVGGSNHRKAVRDYLQNRLFAFINNYPRFLAERARASAWSPDAGRKWSDSIASAAADAPRLPGLVDTMAADLRS